MNLCDKCETVSHCTAKGCIPLTECINSGQVSAAQVVAQAENGDFKPRLPKPAISTPFLSELKKVNRGDYYSADQVHALIKAYNNLYLVSHPAPSQPAATKTNDEIGFMFWETAQPAAPVELPVVNQLDRLQTNMELSFDHGDEGDEGFWCVHQVHGGINDREWTLIGKGRTVGEAVNAAIAAGRKAS